MKKADFRVSSFLSTTSFPILLLCFILFCACSSGDAKAQRATEGAQSGAKCEFVMATLPDSITDSKERARYLVAHFWDNFDFSNPECSRLPESIEKPFITYLRVLPYAEQSDISLSIKDLLSKSEKEKTGQVYSILCAFFKKYLCDPNSPIRNEELYIPVAEYIVNDAKTNAADKQRAKFDLEMMMKNRVGEVATDFTYMLSSKRTSTLHQIKSEYTILYFYNPDCHACAEIIEGLINSDVIKSLQQQKRLTVLSFYPDADLEIWNKHLADIPTSWINAYDEKQLVEGKKMYDLKAIPTLYLLDKDKKVILKDTDFLVLEYWLQQNTQ